MLLRALYDWSRMATLNRLLSYGAIEIIVKLLSLLLLLLLLLQTGGNEESCKSS